MPADELAATRLAQLAAVLPPGDVLPSATPSAETTMDELREFSPSVTSSAERMWSLDGFTRRMASLSRTTSPPSAAAPPPLPVASPPAQRAHVTAQGQAGADEGTSHHHMQAGAGGGGGPRAHAALHEALHAYMAGGSRPMQPYIWLRREEAWDYSGAY